MPDNISSGVQAAEVYSPEEAMSYADWLKSNDVNKWLTGDQSFWSRIIRWYTGEDKKNEANYQNYLNNLNIRNENKALQSAYAYDEYMSNTAYSRAFKDLEKMGVNPYLLLNSGSTPSTTTGSSSKPSYSVSKSGIKDAQSGDKEFATILLAIASLLTKQTMGNSSKSVNNYFLKR